VQMLYFFQCFQKKERKPKSEEKPKATKQQLIEQIWYNEEMSQRALRRAESFFEKGELQKAILELRKRKHYKMEQLKVEGQLLQLTASPHIIQNPLQTEENVKNHYESPEIK
jgi:predicted negative regulator of RcsB-dependent stress response